MSENEIKPVFVDHTIAAHVASEFHGERYGIDWIWHHDGIGLLHPQSAIDRLTEERDAYRLQAAHETDVAEVAAQEIKRLKAERDAAVADAERYQWLRDKAMMGTKHDPAVLKDGPTDCCEFMFGEELDAAIDAARSEASA